MSKKTAVIVLILGLVIMVGAVIDITRMGELPTKMRGFGSVGELGTWTPLRLAILSAGGLLGLLGAYGIFRKSRQK